MAWTKSSKRWTTLNWSLPQPKARIRALPQWLMLLGGALLLAACSRSSLPAEGGLFIAPSIDPNSEPLILETYTPLPATPTAPCENNMVFLQDLTIPDGTTLAPGQEFEKVWQVRNEGSCPWTAGYYLRFTEGDPLGSLGRIPLPASRSGDVIEIYANFVAPDEPGNYRSSWKTRDFGDNEFGVLIYLEINVR